MTFQDGAWQKLEVISDPYIKLHIAATALHYGQACFEGLKAYMGKDGRVRVFRAEANARRMNESAARLCMPELPVEAFVEAVKCCVRENVESVPAYGEGTLYVRPFLFGSGPQIGLSPADEFTFMVMVTPVGHYYAAASNGGGGGSGSGSGSGGGGGGGEARERHVPDMQAMRCQVQMDNDRAAPLGMGHVKAAGNYAPSLLPSKRAKEAGFGITLYLDAAERKYVEEFATSNFVGIKGGAYVTPDSPSILRSITNLSLQMLAADAGLKVERRRVPWDEVATFEEVGACGTAVVLTMVNQFTRDQQNIVLPKANFEILAGLKAKLEAIQRGDEEDKHGWLTIL